MPVNRTLCSKKINGTLRLKGTKTEDEFRAELLQSKSSIFAGSSKNHLGEVLRGIFPTLKTAYVLNWVPEQSEDIYVVLVNGEDLLSIEIDREGENQPEIEHMNLNEYRKNLTKVNQIRLLVASHLSSEDMYEHK